MPSSHFRVMGHGQDAEAYYGSPPLAQSLHQSASIQPPTFPNPPPPPSSPRLPLVYRELGFDQRRDVTPPPTGEVFKIPPTSAPKPVKEPADGKKTAASKTRFGPTACRDLVAVMVEKDPWNAKHGKKGEKWKEGCEVLWGMGHFKGSSVATIQHKMESLMDWKDGSGAASCQVIEKEMTQTMFIQTAGCLERALWLREGAKKKAQEKKDADLRKEEEDEAGGASIRDASMTVFKRRHESPNPTPTPSPSPSSKASTSSIHININTPPSTPSKACKRTHDTDGDDEEPSPKRRAVGRGSANREGIREVARLLKKSEERQERQGKELVAELRSSTHVYGEKTAELIGVLRSFQK